MLLTNYLFDKGPELAAALGATVTAADKATCTSACGTAHQFVSEQGVDAPVGLTPFPFEAEGYREATMNEA